MGDDGENHSIADCEQHIIKAAPWDDFNSRFYFSNEEVHPPDHLTILRRFSWPSLAYMCTKVV